MKNSIELATFRLVAQHLNRYSTAVPYIQYKYVQVNIIYFVKFGVKLCNSVTIVTSILEHTGLLFRLVAYWQCDVPSHTL